MIDIRLPHINGATNEENIEKIKSYLIQLVQELNYILNQLDDGKGDKDGI